MYALAFVACRLSTSPIDWPLFWSQSLLPDQVVANWLGAAAAEPMPATLADRWPLVGAALAIWLAAWGVGRLVLRAVRMDEHLSTLERFVFSAGTGRIWFRFMFLPWAWQPGSSGLRSVCR